MIVSYLDSLAPKNNCEIQQVILPPNRAISRYQSDPNISNLRHFRHFSSVKPSMFIAWE